MIHPLVFIPGRVVLLAWLALSSLMGTVREQCLEYSETNCTKQRVEEGWECVQSDENIHVYNRAVKDSPIREILAESIIESPTWRVFAVISDFNRYKEFMPYVEESQIVKDEAGIRWVFQQLSFPWPISDRYYTIKLSYSLTHSDPPAYTIHWTLADNQLDLPQGDGEPLRLNMGSWELRAVCGKPHTHVTYFVLTDPGGLLPSWIINMANSIAVPDVIEAIRERVRHSDYDSFKPH